MRKNTDKALQTLSSTQYSINVNYYSSQLLTWMVGWFRFAYYQFCDLLAWDIWRGGWYSYNLNLPVFVELSCKEPNVLGRYFVPSYHNSAHIIGCGWSPCVMPAHGILRHWVEGRRAEKRGWPPLYRNSQILFVKDALHISEGAQPAMLERSRKKSLRL